MPDAGPAGNGLDGAGLDGAGLDGRWHLAGIGGAGMSPIARILLERGARVSGSDLRDSPLLAELAGLGARVSRGHDAGQLDGFGPGDTLVVSTAIRQDNPELARARELGVRVLHRSQALAAVMAGRRVIAVAGTHGKTSTTSMLVTVLRELGAGPGYAIGGVMRQAGAASAAAGTGPDFIAEADESDRSFLNLGAWAGIITNVEADHLDNYRDLAEIEDTFTEFAASLTGPLVICADDPGAGRVAARVARRRPDLPVTGYGEGAGADVRVTDWEPEGLGARFALRWNHGRYEKIRLAVPGRHNALNAAASFAMAVRLGHPAGRVAAALAEFRGARRRLDPVGEAAGVRVLDTYAHHPTELAADLRAVRDLAAGGRVIAVFQPHLYSRTRMFAGEFGAALGLADLAVVLDVYAAREDPEPGVTGELVAAAVPERDGAAGPGAGGARRAIFQPDAGQLPDEVAALAQSGDVLVTMGAGDVTELGPRILAALSARRTGQGQGPGPGPGERVP